MAAIVLLCNQPQIEAFSEMLSQMFLAEAQVLKSTSLSELMGLYKRDRKTLFAVYCAAYWLTLTIHSQLDKSKALSHLYNIFSILDLFASNSQCILCIIICSIMFLASKCRHYQVFATSTLVLESIWWPV